MDEYLNVYMKFSTRKENDYLQNKKCVFIIHDYY